MKDLHYSVEVLHSKDESKLIKNYTEAVCKILKNKLSPYNIEQLILQLKNTTTKKDICINK